MDCDIQIATPAGLPLCPAYITPPRPHFARYACKSICCVVLMCSVRGVSYKLGTYQKPTTTSPMRKSIGAAHVGGNRPNHFFFTPAEEVLAIVAVTVGAASVGSWASAN